MIRSEILDTVDGREGGSAGNTSSVFHPHVTVLTTFTDASCPIPHPGLDPHHSPPSSYTQAGCSVRLHT